MRRIFDTVIARVAILKLNLQNQEQIHYHFHEIMWRRYRWGAKGLPTRDKVSKPPQGNQHYILVLREWNLFISFHEKVTQVF